MRLKYAWIDLPVLALAILLLIPLVYHLIGILTAVISDLASGGH